MEIGVCTLVMGSVSSSRLLKLFQKYLLLFYMYKVCLFLTHISNEKRHQENHW